MTFQKPLYYQVVYANVSVGNANAVIKAKQPEKNIRKQNNGVTKALGTGEGKGS